MSVKKTGCDPSPVASSQFFKKPFESQQKTFATFGQSPLPISLAFKKANFYVRFRAELVLDPIDDNSNLCLAARDIHSGSQ
jgi:hypothetical protein